MRRTRFTRSFGALLGATVFAFGVAACGDSDDDGDGDTTAAFCEYSANLGGAPSNDELDQLRRLAPDEIADDVTTYADGLQRVVEEPGAELSAEEAAAVASIEAWEGEHCRDPSTDGQSDQPNPSDTEPIDIDDVELDDIEPEPSVGDLGEITDIEVLDEPVENFDDGSSNDSTP